MELHVRWLLCLRNMVSTDLLPLPESDEARAPGVLTHRWDRCDVR